MAPTAQHAHLDCNFAVDFIYLLLLSFFFSHMSTRSLRRAMTNESTSRWGAKQKTKKNYEGPKWPSALPGIGEKSRFIYIQIERTIFFCRCSKDETLRTATSNNNSNVSVRIVRSRRFSTESTVSICRAAVVVVVHVGGPSDHRTLWFHPLSSDWTAEFSGFAGSFQQRRFFLIFFWDKSCHEQITGERSIAALSLRCRHGQFTSLAITSN